MSDYLSTYGVQDSRREKRWKIAIWSILIIASLWISAYFFFRTYFEKKTMDRFLALLKERNYPVAYEMWGCTKDKPCRDYAFEKFLEDWGPGSLWSDPHYAEVAKIRYCGDTVIFNMYIKGDDVNLVVNKATQELGFAPWATCTGTIVEMEIKK